jgi:hypothetical protein
VIYQSEKRLGGIRLCPVPGSSFIVDDICRADKGAVSSAARRESAPSHRQPQRAETLIIYTDKGSRGRLRITGSIKIEMIIKEYCGLILNIKLTTLEYPETGGVNCGRNRFL